MKWLLVIVFSSHAFKSSRLQLFPRSSANAKVPNNSMTQRSISWPLVFKKVRPPSRKLKTTLKASRPNLFM
ncbi:60S ribosomal protein L18a-3 [Dendrobium catenatum]|uniref:60S ribosomal protein L18a-3 n=1 Tax=Dendrobium catenatum TaxID=906689 RepID=A0A2I0VRZ0_9ASPA|nr:60S ribosomal protein L18a-3 [Dendrobium catenatum]